MPVEWDFGPTPPMNFKYDWDRSFLSQVDPVENSFWSGGDISTTPAAAQDSESFPWQQFQHETDTTCRASGPQSLQDAQACFHSPGVGAADGLQSNTLETMLLTEEQLNRLDHVTTDHLPENDLAMMFEAAPDVVSVELETCRQQQQAASAPPPPGLDCMYGIGHEAGISSTPTCQASLNDHPHDCVFPFVPQPPLQTHSYGVFGDAYCDVGMPDHAAGSQFTLLDGGHEEYSQLRSAKNSHSQRDAASIFDYNESPQQDSFLSAFSTAQGSGGVGNESPCWPVHSSEQYVQQYEFTTSAGAAAAAALCSSGALHRRTFRMVPSGLSRESTMTHFGRPSGGYKFSPDDSMGTARQPFSNDMATHNDDFLAPLVPGSNKKRKALDAGTHATPQGLLHTTESSLFMESIPTLLPHLGGSSLTQDNMLQSLQPEPAAMQPGSSVLDATPLHAAGLGTGQDYFTVSTSPKRQRLSRASSSWESSQFAAAALPPLAADRGLPSAWLPFPMAAPVGNHTHGLYPFTPLPLPTYTPYEEYPQAPAGAPAPPPLFHPPTNHPAVPQGPTDAPEHGLFHPHALPQAVQSAPQQTLEALSGSSPPRPPPPPQTARPAGTRAAPQASRHSRTRFPPQASRRSRLKCASQAQPLVDPHANPRAAPEAPAHAAPQEPPPQAAIPTTPQEGPVSDQRVRPQAGRVVWAKCGGYPWWPAIVRRPTAAEKEKTQWSRGQVFVEYFGTEQIQALSTLDVKRWREKSGPRKPRADLKGAVEQASRAVSRGARV